MSMYKKIILTFVFMILGAEVIFAQNHFLTLSNQQLKLSEKAYNITKVIDERSNKANIGWTQKGMANVRVNANFSNSFEEEVLGFISSNIDLNGENIQLIVRTLQISEKTGAFSEKGFCDISVDFLLEKDSKTYLVLKSVHKSEVKGTDVTKKHPKNIASAFKLCFDELSKVDLTKTDSFLAIDVNGKEQKIPDEVKYNFPIFKEIIKTGIYANYDELKNNTPSNTEEFVIEKKKRTQAPWIGTLEITPKFKDKGKKVKEVWAIAYEGRVYIYHQKEFFPLTIDNYELYFNGYGIPSNESISTGAMVGGLIGVGIAAGAENKKAKKQKVKYNLDPDTGGFLKKVLLEEVK